MTGAGASLVGSERLHAQSVPAEVFDSHVHFFNGSDLSIARFFQVVVLRNYEDEYASTPAGQADCKPPIRFGRGVGVWLRRVSDRLAPTAREELAVLGALSDDGSDAAPHELVESEPARRERASVWKFTTASDDELEELYREALADVLREIRNEHRRASETQQEAVPDEALADPDPDGFGALLDGIDDELGLDVRDRFDQVQEFLAIDARNKIDQLIARSQRRRAPITSIGAILDWAFLLTLPRDRIIKRYIRLYGDAGVTGAATYLVDYAKWLQEPPAEGSDFDAQLDVMGALRGRYHDQLDIRICAPFDPLGQAFDEAAAGQELNRLSDSGVDPRLEASPFGRLQIYLANSGLHGVKLYPPMGFRPYGNSSIPQDRMPTPVLNEWRGVGQSVQSLGSRLDSVMRRFLEWAAENEVPVVTHAGNSVDAGCGFAERGHVDEWIRVLAASHVDETGVTRSGLGLSNLKLNLGHFGDMRAFMTSGPESASWAWSKGPLLHDYPNVYADLSFMEEFIRTPWFGLGRIRRFFSRLRVFAARYDPNMEKLMLGTDWVMLGQLRRHDRYLERAIDGMDSAGYSQAEIDNLCFRNARRFFSL